MCKAILNLTAVLCLMACSEGDAAAPATEATNDYKAITISSEDVVWHLTIMPDGSGRLAYGGGVHGRDLASGTYDFKKVWDSLHTGAGGFHVLLDSPETRPRSGSVPDPSVPQKERAASENSEIRDLFRVAFKAPALPRQDGAAQDVLDLLKEHPLLPARTDANPTTQEVAGCKEIRISADKRWHLYIRADGTGALFYSESDRPLFPGADAIEGTPTPAIKPRWLPPDDWDNGFLEAMRDKFPGIGPGVCFPIGTFDMKQILHDLHKGTSLNFVVSIYPDSSGFDREEAAPDPKQLRLLFDKAFKAASRSGEEDLSEALLERRNQHPLEN